MIKLINITDDIIRGKNLREVRYKYINLFEVS